MNRNSPVSPTLIFALVVLTLAGGLSSAQAVWQLTWSDEFNGTNIDTTKWTFETGNNNGWGNGEREYYTGRTNNAYVSGGYLHIVARQESTNGFPYTSARMKSEGLFSQTYGKFEWRAKLPQGLGYWPALWMLGNNIESIGWPACGEIDVMENNGSYNNQVQGTLHYSDTNNNHLSQTRIYALPGDYATNFHTYSIEWSTNLIKWVVDGVSVQAWTTWSSYTNPYPAPFNKPFFILMNMAIGGSYLGYPSDGTINSNTIFPGEMQVDYVRVYTDVPGTNAPAQVTGLNASASSTAVYLNWDASQSGAIAYNMKRSSVSGGPYATINSPTTNSYTDNGLSGCSTYYYVVSGTNSFGDGTNSTEVAVTLPSSSLAVNSGGSGVNQFAADTYFSGGTQANPFTTTVDTSSVGGAAQQAVYQTERYGNFSYAFPGLTTGRNYLLRLHFAELYWTSAGQREFNVSINGIQVLTNFDILAAAGAANRAIIKEFSVTPQLGAITVQFTTAIDNAKVSGIELLPMPPPAPAGLHSTAGDSTVNLMWSPSSGATYNVKRSAAFSGPYLVVTNGLSVTNFTDTGLSNGTTYYYVVSDTIGGCESTNSAAISAIPICSTPPTPVAGNNGPIWAGMGLNLSASAFAGAAYNWSGPNAFLSTNQNPTISSAPASASGTYSVTITVGSCVSAPGFTTVAVNPVPSIQLQSAGGDTILNWTAGTLQSSTNIPGSWQNLPSATSPYTNPPGLPQIFYRLKLPQ